MMTMILYYFVCTPAGVPNEFVQGIKLLGYFLFAAVEDKPLVYCWETCDRDVLALQ